MFNSCSIRTTFQQCKGLYWFLRDWYRWGRVLFVLFYVGQNGVFCSTSHLQVVKRYWWKGVIHARSKNCVYMQLIISPVEFKIVHIRHLMPASIKILCTYTWSTSLLISIVPSCLEVRGTTRVDGCSKSLVFAAATSSNSQKNFLKICC